MKMSEAYPSKYLKAEDLKGRRVVLMIDHVTMEDIGDNDNKPVVYFSGHQKGLVLNKTNASQISYMYGDESDGWQGKQIELFVQVVPFQGRQVPAIRIAPPAGQTMESTPMPDGRPTLNAPPVQTDPLDDPLGF